MAKLKKSARKTTSANNSDLQAQAERLSKNLGESAQQVWLAGVGAFGRAQAEGSKLFETLVKEGLSVEQITRKVAGGKVDAVRDAVESKVGQARERATDTWDRLEKVFEERVQRALRRLEVPSRQDLGALIDRVDALNGELRKLGGMPRKSAPKKAAAKAPAKAAKKPATRKPAAKKAVKKTVRKSAV
jgi:poly(hydroxyalkanoate) granule-associated protein